MPASVAWLRISSKPSSTFGERHLYAAVWQFAQSPGEETHSAFREVRARSNCYAPW